MHAGPQDFEVLEVGVLKVIFSSCRDRSRLAPGREVSESGVVVPWMLSRKSSSSTPFLSSVKWKSPHSRGFGL